MIIHAEKLKKKKNLHTHTNPTNYKKTFSKVSEQKVNIKINCVFLY